MSRVNLCTNPHADVDTSGWTSNGTLTRVTATGFPKSHAVESSSGTALVWTARGAVVVGSTYVISAQIKNVSAVGNANPFIEWRDASDAALSYSAGTSTNCPTGVVTTVSATGTAPASAAYAALLIGNMSGVRQVGAALIEPGSSASAYADGDTSNWTWDGTAGLSSSTQGGVTGVAAAALGALTATATGTPKVLGTATASLGALTAAATGTPKVLGTATSSLGTLAASATGHRLVSAAATSSLGALTATATGQRTAHATAAAHLGALFATASDGSVAVNYPIKAGTVADLAVHYHAGAPT